jgi:Tol biopolymer transport system component
MKATKYLVLSLPIVIILSILITGCKKEKDENYLPQGLSGKFLFLTYSWDNKRIYSVDADGKTLLMNVPSFCDNLGIVRWSPDGSKILFVTSGGDFYPPHTIVMNSDGTTQREISPGDTNTYGDWSPDGKKIILVRLNESIVTLNADGSGILPLPHGTSPKWSPDGTRIVFVNGGSVYKVNADGSELDTLTSGTDPCWSLDGLQIYFLNSTAIWSITLSDHSTRKMADMPQVQVCDLSWSPKRTQVLFFTKLDIQVMNLDGSKLIQLVNHSEPLYSSYFNCTCWFPDGTKVTYKSDDGGFYVINVDGSNPIRLNTNLSLDGTIMAVDWH